MLRRMDCLETYKLNLHCKQCPHDIKDIIGHINSLVKSISYNKEDHEYRNDVNNERISTPGSNHIKITRIKIILIIYAKEAYNDQSTDPVFTALRKR